MDSVIMMHLIGPLISSVKLYYKKIYIKKKIIKFFVANNIKNRWLMIYRIIYNIMINRVLVILDFVMIQ
jgi:hypothetical protein